MMLRARFGDWRKTSAFVALWFGFFMIISGWFEPLPVSAIVRQFSNLIVEPGETVTVRYDAIKQRDGCFAKIDRWWIDMAGNIIAQNETETRDLDKENIDYSGTVIVPFIASRGVLRLRSKVEFLCNGVQQALGGSKVTLPDAYFVVR